MSWMAWTPVTAVFFVVMGTLIAGMTGWEALSPCVPRRGLLPLVTTRGDRLFIGLLTTAFIQLAWLGLTDESEWYALAIGVVVTLAIGRFG